MIWGLLVQNITYALTVPIFLILCLARSTTTSPTERAITADIFEVISIPASLFMGFAIPAVMLALPAPAMQSFEAKQTWIAVWQGFPIWVAVFQQIIKRYISIMLPTLEPPSTARKGKALQRVYIILVLFAGISHVVPMALIVTSSMFPGLLPANYAQAFTFSRVILPAAMTSKTQMSSVGSGALLLLQYDEIIGSTAVLLWALLALLQACSHCQGTRPWFSGLWRLTLVTALTGPAGCAVSLISFRDGIVLEQSDGMVLLQKDAVISRQEEKRKTVATSGTRGK